MRAVLVAVMLLGACAGSAPELPEEEVVEEEVPEVEEPVVDGCAEIAESFCTRTTECFTSLPMGWCVETELDLCEASWNYEFDDCLADIELLECEGQSVTVPCSCNPGQDVCK